MIAKRSHASRGDHTTTGPRQPTGSDADSRLPVCAQRDLQEHRVILVGRSRTGPRQSGYVCLKLEDGLNRRAPDGGYAKFGPREHLAILGLDAIVDRDPEMSCEQCIDQSPGRPEW